MVLQTVGTAAETGSTACPAAVKSPQEAVAKADWIIEGTISTVYLETGSNLPSLIVEDVKVVRQGDSRKLGTNLDLAIGPCFPFLNELTEKSNKPAGRFTGKRMRFFGNQHTVSPLRRTFYVQPADVPMPPAASLRAFGTAGDLVTASHRHAAENPIGGGWHRAKSTDGGFSIDMPGPFDDATRMEDGQQGYMLRAVDSNGVTYLAVFERSSLTATMRGTFDQEYRQSSAGRLVFKGMPAVAARSDPASFGKDLVSHSLFVRVPGGTYMLGVVAPKNMEPQALKSKERFLDSLSFD